MLWHQEKLQDCGLLAIQSSLSPLRLCDQNPQVLFPFIFKGVQKLWLLLSAEAHWWCKTKGLVYLLTTLEKSLLGFTTQICMLLLQPFLVSSPLMSGSIIHIATKASTSQGCVCVNWKMLDFLPPPPSPLLTALLIPSLGDRCFCSKNGPSSRQTQSLSEHRATVFALLLFLLSTLFYTSKLLHKQL